MKERVATFRDELGGDGDRPVSGSRGRERREERWFITTTRMS